MTNPSPSSATDRSAIDSEHLRMLAIFHFVSAGFALCGLLFIGFHFAMFKLMVSNPKLLPPQAGSPSPADLFKIFSWVYVVLATWFVASGMANLLSGCFLRTRKHRVFSIVVAGWNCIYMPLGTILGVFTLIVLSRDSVRRLYESNAS